MDITRWAIHATCSVKRIATVMAANPTDVFMSAIDAESDRALLLLPRYIVRQLPKIAASIAAK